MVAELDVKQEPVCHNSCQKNMSEIESKSVLLKSKYKHSDQQYSANSCNEDDNDHDWWASDSGSSTGSYYSDTDR